MNQISKEARIAENVTIGSFCIIEEGVEIESDTVISDFVVIRKGTKIKKNVQIGNNSIIEKKCHISENSILDSYSILKEGVSIGKDSKCGSFTIIHKDSSIGDNNFVGPYCELGINTKTKENVIVQGRNRFGDQCILEKNVTVKYGTILTEKVLLKEYAFLGPNVITLGSTHERVTVHGTIIGSNSYIGAGSKIAGGIEIGDEIVVGALCFVNKDIRLKGIYVGTPVKKIK